MNETPQVPGIIFQVSEDDVDGGYTASALDFGIHTQAESVEELCINVCEAVECYFGEATAHPRIIGPPETLTCSDL